MVMTSYLIRYICNLVSICFKSYMFLCVTPYRWRSTAETCNKEDCIFLVYTLNVQSVDLNNKKHKR